MDAVPVRVKSNTPSPGLEDSADLSPPEWKAVAGRGETRMPPFQTLIESHRFAVLQSEHLAPLLRGVVAGRSGPAGEGRRATQPQPPKLSTQRVNQIPLPNRRSDTLSLRVAAVFPSGTIGTIGEAKMAVFVPAYLRALALLQVWGKGKRAVIQQQIDFLETLAEEAKTRLEEGEYPPYHLVRAASRAVGVPVETCKNWLLAFLYWRSKSLGLSKPPNDPEWR